MNKFILVLLTLAPSAGFSWGQLGHRVVGKIAENHLCPVTKTKVSRILEGESLAQASTWADEVRGIPYYRYLGPWHFVSVNAHGEYKDSPKSKRGDVVNAIAKQVEVLKTGSGKPAEQKMALRLLIHFVGDAHQPLHAGREHDHGGNTIAVEWFGTPVDLHWVWDTGILRQEDLSYTEMATFIDRPGSGQENIKLLTPEHWVNESARLADGVYDTFDKTKVKLGYPYYDKFIGPSHVRLLDGGVRLAGLLQEIFGCQ